VLRMAALYRTPRDRSPEQDHDAHPVRAATHRGGVSNRIF
jgi:hypothetical protein